MFRSYSLLFMWWSYVKTKKSAVFLSAINLFPYKKVRYLCSEIIGRQKSMLCAHEICVGSCEYSLTSFWYSQKEYVLFQEFVRDIRYIHKKRSSILCFEDNIDADVVGKYNYKNSFSCLLKCVGPVVILWKVRICCKVCVHSLQPVYSQNRAHKLNALPIILQN